MTIRVFIVFTFWNVPNDSVSGDRQLWVGSILLTVESLLR